MYLYYRLGHDLENQLQGHPPIGEVLQHGILVDIVAIKTSQKALASLSSPCSNLLVLNPSFDINIFNFFYEYRKILGKRL